MGIEIRQLRPEEYQEAGRVTASAWLLAAIAMYEAMGFTREPDKVFPDGFRLLSYRLQLP